VVLGLGEEEFWSLMPAQFDALCQRHREQEERADWRAGLICSVLANIHRDPKRSRTFKPQDFMPVYAKSTEGKPQEVSENQMLEQMMLMNTLLGGKTVEK